MGPRTVTYPQLSIIPLEMLQRKAESLGTQQGGSPRQPRSARKAQHPCCLPFQPALFLQLRHGDRYGCGRRVPIPFQVGPKRFHRNPNLARDRLQDARSCADPFVRCGQQVREIVVGQFQARKVFAKTGKKTSQKHPFKVRRP